MREGLSREAINQRLLYHMRLQSSDAAVVLDARAVSGEVAREAARQYHAGLYNKLILTGGVRVRQPAILLRLLLTGRLSGIIDSIKCNGLRDFLSSKCEADYMHDQLRTHGVSSRDIISVDRRAQNTGDNFDYVRNSLKQFRSVSIVCTAENQRRALGTLRIRPEFNHVAAQSVPVYPFGMRRDNWDRRILGIGPAAFGRRLRQEYAKITPGMPGNYISHFCIDPDIQREEMRMKRQRLKNLNLSA